VDGFDCPAPPAGRLPGIAGGVLAGFPGSVSGAAGLTGGAPPCPLAAGDLSNPGACTAGLALGADGFKPPEAVGVAAAPA